MAKFLRRLTGRPESGVEGWIELSAYAPLYKRFLESWLEWGRRAETTDRIDTGALFNKYSPTMTFEELGYCIEDALAADRLYVALVGQRDSFISLADKVPQGLWNVNVSTVRTLAPMVDLEGWN